MNSSKLRWIGFASGVLGAAFMAHGPLLELKELARRDEMHSHLPLIPALAAYFFWSARKSIGSLCCRFTLPGVMLGFLGLALYKVSLGGELGLQAQDRIALSVFSMVLVVQGLFISLFGLRAAKEAAFPLLFLFFVVPLPVFLQDWLVGFLQKGSAEATNLIFQLSWVPFFREGFVFQVPGISVEVAPQCGGIRSGIALVITSVVAGKFFLAKGWSRLLLVLASIPITVFKNGLRIVGLTLGAIYVDPRILDSELHRSGGIPFFGLALAMMAPVLWALYRAEKFSLKFSRTPKNAQDTSVPSSRGPMEGEAQGGLGKPQ